MPPRETLAERHAREQAVRDRNEQARRAIRQGYPMVLVMQDYGLSKTAYHQLAGQVRAG